MAAKSNIALIILAAGGSSRMGQPKQLLPWGKTTLLGYAIEEALKSKAKNVYVVLGAYFEEIKVSIKEQPIKILKNRAWKNGMGSSIALAINNLKENDFDGALFMLGDQPQVDSVFLNKLITNWQKNQPPIIASSYNNKGGVPALFDKSFFNKLSSLKGEEGARKVIGRNKSEVFILSHHTVLDDIDTVETYNRLLDRL